MSSNEMMGRRRAELLEVIAELGKYDEQALAIAAVMADTLRAGGKILFFGNGGSSMDAGHLAAELLGRFGRERPALAVVSLADHTAAMTAIGNDYGFDEVFSRQIQGLGRPGDVVVGLTTSGNSPNVVRGLEQAGQMGLITVALTGRAGGAAAEIADLCIRMPTNHTPRVQEATLHLGHTVCELIESMLFADPLSVTTVFLDRDGTLNTKPDDGAYITSPNALHLMPGVGAAIARLNGAGIRVIVVTNQRGVARGLMEERELAAVHEQLQAALGAQGAKVDRFYACVHEVGACSCRKPQPGLILRAAQENPGIDLSCAVMIGDSETDVAAGVAAGTATIRLADTRVRTSADLVAPDLATAVTCVLNWPTAQTLRNDRSSSDGNLRKRRIEARHK